MSDKRFILGRDGRVISMHAFVVEYLLAQPDDLVERAAIRRQLPPGRKRVVGPQQNRTRKLKGQAPTVKNAMSDKLQKVLKDLAEQGLIERGDKYVQILDREGLRKLDGSQFRA